MDNQIRSAERLDPETAARMRADQGLTREGGIVTREHEHDSAVERYLTVLYDPTKRRPGCVILQAITGCDQSAVYEWEARTWLLAPTEGMVKVKLTAAEVKKLAQQDNSREASL